MSSFPESLSVAAALRVFCPARLDDILEIVEVHIRSWQAACRDLLPSELLDGLSLTVVRRVTYLSAVRFYQVAGFVVEPHTEKTVEKCSPVLPVLRYPVPLNEQRRDV